MNCKRLSFLKWPWLWLVIWGVLELFSPGLSARGDTPWVPTERHFRIAAQGRDCSIYRVLTERTRKELAETRALVAGESQMLKSRRKSLEECARRRGVREWNDDGEALAAELCPEEYAGWISPGYRLVAYRQDLSSEERALKSLVSELRLRCPSLPMPTVSSGS